MSRRCLLLAKLKVLASADAKMRLALASLALQSQGDLLRGLCLLVENWLGLSSESCCGEKAKKRNKTKRSKTRKSKEVSIVSMISQNGSFMYVNVFSVTKRCMRANGEPRVIIAKNCAW